MTRRKRPWPLASRARFAIRTSKSILSEPGLSAVHFDIIGSHLTSSRDTVSSIGIIRGQHLLPSTIDGMSHVCYFRHALALDERRVKFLPEYSYGGSASPRLNNSEETPLIPIPFYIHVLCFLVVIPLAIRLFVFYATFTLVG